MNSVIKVLKTAVMSGRYYAVTPRERPAIVVGVYHYAAAEARKHFYPHRYTTAAAARKHSNTHCYTTAAEVMNSVRRMSGRYAAVTPRERPAIIVGFYHYSAAAARKQFNQHRYTTAAEVMVLPPLYTMIQRRHHFSKFDFKSLQSKYDNGEITELKAGGDSELKAHVDSEVSKLTEMECGKVKSPEVSEMNSELKPLEVDTEIDSELEMMLDDLTGGDSVTEMIESAGYSELEMMPDDLTGGDHLEIEVTEMMESAGDSELEMMPDGLTSGYSVTEMIESAELTEMEPEKAPEPTSALPEIKAGGDSDFKPPDEMKPGKLAKLKKSIGKLSLFGVGLGAVLTLKLRAILSSTAAAGGSLASGSGSDIVHLLSSIPPDKALLLLTTGGLSVGLIKWKSMRGNQGPKKPPPPGDEGQKKLPPGQIKPPPPGDEGYKKLPPGQIKPPPPGKDE